MCPSPAALPDPRLTTGRNVVLPAHVLAELLHRAGEIHAAGLKSYGLFAAHPDRADYPYTADEVVFFDPAKNRRNDPLMRPAFEAQGSYFREYDDAGFVADSRELLTVHRRLESAGLEVVAMFHSHRRQPANFSHIDYRLHNPAYPWHLIIGLSDPQRPVLAAFEVRKDLVEFGIDPADRNDGSECTYPGPEVAPLTVVRQQAAA